EPEITRRILAEGLDPEEEFEQYLVSPEIGNAVWELSGTKSADADAAQERRDAQFNREDISIDEMESALWQVLKLQSDDGKRIPLTLIVLDEVQQYIGDSGARAGDPGSGRAHPERLRMQTARGRHRPCTPARDHLCR
ncbi:MAG: hypothetical protein M3440_13760, partial [Chloroflexota bacterium]|nr:hypothetical protein [Chloroflexota bacterium]